MKLPWVREEAKLILDAAILLLNLRTELVGFNQTKTVYSGAMQARCLELNALYNELARADGEDRSREDDILAAALALELEKHGAAPAPAPVA